MLRPPQHVWAIWRRESDATGIGSTAAPDGSAANFLDNICFAI
jgi:hypothetical protein